MIGRRQFMLGASVAVSVAAAGFAVPVPELIVKTRNGLVRGRLTNDVRTFTGIPYGKAPIGPLRFKVPLPASSWRGELDATSQAATPPQNVDPGLPPVAPMSEDCLQLNIWTPAGPGPYPVLVWIYGGGNSTGAINQPAYQGEKFARDGVICVSVNYRLGVWGFLELGGVTGSADVGSGNNALRDQLLALQWVQNNIAAFGGDPRRVSIGGQSAGAWNCSALMAVPAARGLFHQAIIASGGGDAVYTLDRATEFARLFVAKLGGRERLAEASVEDILKSQLAAESEFSDPLPYRPVIDGTFLPAVPVDSIRAGGARHIKTMIGHTQDEYRTFLSAAQAEKSVTQKMFLHHKVVDLPRIRLGYDSAFPNLTAGDRMLRLLGDEFLGMPTLGTAEALAAAGGTVYYYNLRYSIPTGPLGPYSAHGIDVPLIFEQIDTAFARNVFGFSSKELAMAQIVHAAWISFVKTGALTGELSGWPAYDIQQRETMIMDRTPTVVADPERAVRMIWAGLHG
jgi:para-nitrobenzyl esterase